MSAPLSASEVLDSTVPHHTPDSTHIDTAHVTEIEETSGKVAQGLDLVSEESLLAWIPGYELRGSWWFTVAIMALLGSPFYLVPFNRLQEDEMGHIPLFLTLAWYFLMSWFLGRLSAVFYGPPVLGYLISGFCLQFVFIPSWSSTRSTIQLLSFLIVLTRAGLEISPGDLNKFTLVLGSVPVLGESLVIGIFSMAYLNFSFVQGCLMGLIMSCIGDGLVLPKLSEYKKLNLANGPRYLMTAAPLEVVVTLFTFGIVEGFALDSDEPLYSRLLVGLIAKFFGTIIFAFGVAFLFAQLARNRADFKVFGRKYFTGDLKEELLLVLSSVLIIHSLCDGEPVIIFDGVSHESPLFQADMDVILMMFFYGQFRSVIIHELEHSLTEIWMFGALFLFTTLGSNIKISSFNATFIIPIMFVGFAARFIFIIGTVYFFQKFKSWSLVFYESLFLFVSSIPRATIQGALCRIPMIIGLFDDNTNMQMLNAGVFVLAICAPIGSVLMDATGVKILTKIHELNAEFPEDSSDEVPVIPTKNIAPITMEFKRRSMFTNSAFFICGTLILGSSVNAISGPSAVLAKINLPSCTLVVGLLIFVASIVCTVAFLRQELYIYQVSVWSQALLVVVQVICGIVLFSQVGKISDWIMSSWDFALSADIKDVQNELNCCGLLVFNLTQGTSGLAAQPCPIRSSIPCFDAMVSDVSFSFTTTGGLVFGLALLQGFLVYYSRSLYQGLKNIVDDFHAPAVTENLEIIKEL